MTPYQCTATFTRICELSSPPTNNTSPTNFIAVTQTPTFSIPIPNVPTSSFSNTQPYDNINATLYNLQYDRYCNRGGTLSPVSTKPTIDTIALINATWPLGTYPYCQHFHQNVTPHYYSLGRATTEWKHWLNYTDTSP